MIEQKILNYLKVKTPKLCVISTCSPKGKPECAVVEYSILDDLTVIICTDKNSRKWRNLKNNQNVALTFGFIFEELNIQYEGLAKLITQKDDGYDECEKYFFLSHPESLRYKGLPETVFIKISPLWLRLSDYTINPPRIEEKTLQKS